MMQHNNNLQLVCEMSRMKMRLAAIERILDENNIHPHRSAIRFNESNLLDAKKKLRRKMKEFEQSQELRDKLRLCKDYFNSRYQVVEK